MTKYLLYFKKLDWIFILAVLLLVNFGFLSLYVSSAAKRDFLNLKKQIIFVVFGFFLMFLLSFFDWHTLREESRFILILYFLCIVLLAGLFFFAPEIRNVKSWYKIGFISFDPIEFTKLVLIILLAKYFSMRHIEMYKVVHILISGLYVLIPCVLIFLQPDLGSVLVLICLWIGILLISGITLRHFLILLLCGALLFFLSWSNFLKDYQKERILNFIAPQVSDSLKIGWNQRQAKIAIGSGGLFGQGIENGSQTKYGFLPEPQTDFVFAVIAESTGLIGVALLLFLFFILIWRIMKIAAETNSNFFRLFAVGFAIILISQLFIHIGMNLGILPIIGIPLPLVSYGGSGIIFIFLAFGILQSIKREG